MTTQTIKYSGKAPDLGAEQSGVSSPAPTVDVVGALASAQQARRDLLASNGWKNARAQNVSDTKFFSTYVGKCQLGIEATIKKLGG